MKIALLALLFFGIEGCKTTASSVDSVEVRELPTYRIEKRVTPITLDGQVVEEAWSAAAPMTLVFPWAANEVKESTTAKIVWDDENLYVAYDNSDYYVHAIVKDHDGSVFKDDCVEIFIAPDADDVSGYVAFEMNVLGTMLDYTTSKAGKGPTGAFDYPWNSNGVEVKVALKDGTTLNNNADRDRGWELEMKIPLTNFDVLRKNKGASPAVWRGNLNRCKGPEMGEYGTWSKTFTDQPNFHLSEFFGRLEFVN